MGATRVFFGNNDQSLLHHWGIVHVLHTRYFENHLCGNGKVLRVWRPQRHISTQTSPESYRPMPRVYFMCNQLLTVIIIRSIPCEFFFPFIGRQPTKRPANNFMVCSCAMSSNYAWLVWLQIIFCSCENETTLFSFLRSLLRENGSFPNIFIVIYQKTNSVTLWYNYYGTPRLSQNIVICQCLATGSPSSKYEYRRASALLRNILACEQALCLGKNSKEREGKGGKGGLRGLSAFPSPHPAQLKACSQASNIQNIRICMGKKPIVSVTYENERISIKYTLPYLKCVLRLSCVVYGPIYGRFMAVLWVLCKRFSLCIKKTVYIKPIKRPVDHTGET